MHHQREKEGLNRYSSTSASHSLLIPFLLSVLHLRNSAAKLNRPLGFPRCEVEAESVSQEAEHQLLPAAAVVLEVALEVDGDGGQEVDQVLV